MFFFLFVLHFFLCTYSTRSVNQPISRYLLSPWVMETKRKEPFANIMLFNILMVIHLGLNRFSTDEWLIGRDTRNNFRVKKGICEWRAQQTFTKITCQQQNIHFWCWLVCSMVIIYTYQPSSARRRRYLWWGMGLLIFAILRVRFFFGII